MTKACVLLLALLGSEWTRGPIASAFTSTRMASCRNGHGAFGVRSKCCMGGHGDAHEFDFVLGEGLQGETALRGTQSHNRRTRKFVTLPDASKATRVTLTSSEALEAPTEGQYEFDVDGGEEGGIDLIDDEFALETEALVTGTEAVDRTLSGLWKSQDYDVIVRNYFIPLLGVSAVSYLAGQKAIEKYNERAEAKLIAYANEMVYHDGDFEEMKMCHNDWYRKLSLTVLPPKSKRMMMKFLEVYAKKRPVSPQAISSLSYVFSLFRLSEQKAASILVEVAETLQDKPASAGKLLFFGKRILKTPEAKESLEPIRQMLASGFKVGGEMFVDKAQETMGTAAYKSAIAAAGKGQTTLTAGWELLGLDKETAELLFEEVKKDGFLTGAQKLYQYDEKKKSDDDEDKKDEDGGADDGADDGPKIYECGDCGYTMFPAKGREFKFMPDSFKCPECGAPKDKFISRAPEL